MICKTDTQDNHSDRRNGHLKRPETAIKRYNKALIFTLFGRNPSARFTDRFFRQKMAIVFNTILVVFRADGKMRRFATFYTVFTSFKVVYAPFSWAWVRDPSNFRTGEKSSYLIFSTIEMSTIRFFILDMIKNSNSNRVVSLYQREIF